MPTPQLIISLSPNGELVTELPGLNGSRRKINLKVSQRSIYAIGHAMNILSDISKIEADETAIKDSTKAYDLLNKLRGKIQAAQEAVNLLSNLTSEDNTTCDILLRILEARLANKNKIGEDGNPTEQQVRHWQKHSGLFGDPSCPFCISEGRFEKGYNRERSIKNLSEFEALRLGLISRGYIQNKNNTDIWSKKNMGNVFLLPNGTLKDHKQVIWSKENKEKLIVDGKKHAKEFGFTPIQPFLKRQGCMVKKQVKMVKETRIEKLKRNNSIPMNF